MVDHNPVTIKGKDATTDLPTDIVVIGGASRVEPTQLAGERNPGTSNQYGVGVDECNITAVAASQTDSAVSSGAPALCFGIIMETAQTGAVTIKDGATTVLSITPGANTFIDLRGAKFNTSIVVTTAASAACAILWRPQS